MINENNKFLIDKKHFKSYINNPTLSAITDKSISSGREWRNNAYSFNTHLDRDNIVKYDRSHKLVKSYFDMFYKHNLRSKRVNTILRRRSSSRFFISRPEIVQNSDMNVMNIYVFDREKQVLEKKILTLTSLNKKFNSTYKVNKKSRALYGTKYMIGKTCNRRLIDTMHDHNYGNLLICKYYIYRYVLSHIGIHTRIGVENNLYSKKNYVLQISIDKNLDKNILVRVINAIKYVDAKAKILIKKSLIHVIFKERKIGKNKNIFYLVMKKVFIVQYYIFKNCVNFINSRDKRMNMTSKFMFLHNKLTAQCSCNYNITRTNLNSSLLNHINKLYYNLNKVSLYLTNLKVLLAKIYGKHVILNLTYLKYPYLNSDIISQLMINKMKDRTRGLHIIMNSCMKMIKIAKRKEKITKPLVNKWGDSILFTNIRNISIVTNKVKALKSLRFKWTTGVSLEASGRLTKRYAISRSVSYDKSKGSLENLSSVNHSFSFLLRNKDLPNMQYSYFQSKRRIGAFGLKMWVSNN